MGKKTKEMNNQKHYSLLPNGNSALNWLVRFLCPFCGVVVNAHRAALKGGGVRCDCGALHENGLSLGAAIADVNQSFFPMTTERYAALRAAKLADVSERNARRQIPATARARYAAMYAKNPAILDLVRRFALVPATGDPAFGPPAA